MYGKESKCGSVQRASVGVCRGKVWERAEGKCGSVQRASLGACRGQE